MSKLLSVKQVRKRLNKRSDGAVYDLVRKNILPPGVVVRLGWNIQFNEDALEDFLARGGTLAQPIEAASRLTVEEVCQK